MESELMSLDDEDMRQRLHATKHKVREAVRQALSEGGIHEYEVKSVTVFVKHLPLQCPAGQEPVWEAVPKPDGTVVYEWVCQKSG